MLRWIYEIIYGAIADCFEMIGNMSAEVFDLEWVQATVKLFTLFGWGLFVAGTVVAVFDVAIEYQCGRANIKTTALNILKGFFACSLIGVVPIELYKEFMQDIVNEIDRESKIIDDLLSLVRMDKPSGAMNISSVNLNELMEIVLKRLKPIAQKKNIELLFESFRPVVAEIDEVKFTQVVSNLVENAIKYNNLDGWVHVALNADYQYFYVRVEDSGIGIPKENQDMVFERFYRVDKARSRETGGTGLGLAIVKKIILMHHGTIKMHSEEDVGTTFTVRIPLNYVQSDTEQEGRLS